MTISTKMKMIYLQLYYILYKKKLYNKTKYIYIFYSFEYENVKNYCFFHKKKSNLSIRTNVIC